MGKTTVMNNVQEVKIQKALDEYLEKEKFETIKIPGSDDHIYEKLKKHKPLNYIEENFIDEFKKSVKKHIKGFKVFVNDPSLVEGKLQFSPGFKPAVGLSYNELERFANENVFRLGTKDEYILFLGWFIDSLINEGWSEIAAWYVVCRDSKTLGHYNNSKNSKDDLEVTGSRKIIGKCDLANVYKILAKDEENDFFWIAGGCYSDNSYEYPLADFKQYRNCNYHIDNGVGWFVM